MMTETDESWDMIRKPLLPVALLSIVLLLAPGYATAAELLVIVRDGCPWCAKWRSEIGHIYPKTDEARIAPAREYNIAGGWPAELDHVSRERFTPTFILMDGTVEIARLRGYPGDEFFWFLLGDMLKKLPDEQQM